MLYNNEYEIKKDFFKRDALIVAQELLGKNLCRNQDGTTYKYTITETECYKGAEDSASHAFRGITPRNRIMYEEGGVLYVYLCYGIHSLLNIVTGEAGNPQGVLIRGVSGVVGPGRVTKYINIDCSFKGTDITVSEKIWIEDEGKKVKYKATPRVGIDYATEKDRKRPWRFFLVKMV